MNPIPPSGSPNLSSTLSSLNNLISLSNHILRITPSPPTLNSNLTQCPFNPHHLLPPHSLFLHHLHCPSSPRPLPLPDLHHLLHNLSYPYTLTHPPSPPLSLSNFFYRHCPAVVNLSHLDTTSLTIPCILSSQFSDTNPQAECHHPPLLPSEYWTISREIDYWNDFPSTYSYSVFRAISGIGIANDRDLSNWIITNSPRYGVVIDTPMQQHIFLLCCLCLKSILKEASHFKDEKNTHFDCPVLNESLTWLASQVSILYGAANGRVFVLNFVKKCIMVGASVLLLFPLGDEKQESRNLDTESEENTKCLQKRVISLSQVAAAVAALHERSFLEHKIKGFWFSQQPSNYQLVAEHSYLSEKANEERKKRVDYRPLIELDGIHRQQSSNQETSRVKTREELLAEERDYKRRRMSYRGKKANQSPLQVMRYMIEEYMEEIKQAGGVESPVKVSEESGLFPSKPSGHDIPIEANNSGKVNHDSPAVTISNRKYCEQQPNMNYCDRSKAVGDGFSRDYEQRKHGHYRSHYRDDQRNADQGKYHRDRASTSPERRRSHSRSREHSSIHHNKQGYSKRHKYDDSSRTRDRSIQSFRIP
ncbi:hypothetical protein RJT34_23288 [Clitoria ternatea]|uniref:CHHC U11-48K-type domain-containing protein n=1 Tax=Clitoria ternatea TaxID=43366 RepID=A0AAN9FKS2_CLITE